MATPVVAGAAAQMLQANPNLIPNLVKALLMYTAQPLPGFNNFEQGAGEVNLEGAMRLARLVRTDNSSEEIGFKVERSTDGVTSKQLTTLAANSKSYASTSLTGGKKYYRVRSYNSNGNPVYTAVVSATPPTK